MKKNDFIQIKGLDLKELTLKAKTLNGEIATAVMDKNMKKLKDVKSISRKKKELAQVLTIIRQKELIMETESRVKRLESGKETGKVKEEKGEKTSH